MKWARCWDRGQGFLMREGGRALPLRHGTCGNAAIYTIGIRYQQWRTKVCSVIGAKALKDLLP